MPAHCFFVVYYEKECADRVDEVCEQLVEALKGNRPIATAPDGVMVEQFVVEKAESWASEDEDGD